MTERPWMKWYPGDWRADPLVRACDPISRYVWMEMIGLMHEAEPYGHLVLSGSTINNKMLCRLIGVDLEAVKHAVKQLEEMGVFSRNEHGVIYSRRMIRDENRRKTGKKNGSLGGSPLLKKQRVKSGGDNPPDKPRITPPDITHIPESKVIRDYTPSSIALQVAAPARVDPREVGKTVLKIMGVYDDPRWYGDASRVYAWVADGADPELDIYPTIRAALARRREKGLDVPRTLSYFDGMVADAIARRTQPLPQGSPGGRSNGKEFDDGATKRGIIAAVFGNVGGSSEDMDTI